MNGEILDEVVLVVADLSGSMAGQPVSRMNVQISELLSELKTTQTMAANSIRFGLLGFHEKKQWLILPAGVDELDHLPMLQIGKRSDGFFARSNYSIMLAELNRCMNRDFLCGNRSLNTVHVLLFSDGFPTDSWQSLKNASASLKKNTVFSNERCRRYVIQEREYKGQGNYRGDFWTDFVNSKENIIQAEQFSELLGDICGELSGIKDDNVFG
ncbi:MAG TPA: VWA domain-containing protein [Candidatus Choladousia intestinavium]|uniref:VWA domain-containing protein n=1 Tax=Candidatus Choladousia intestinavium TaxID=2840727 RepID=A0A9D1D866_9FIRM|nr:VWA domain-containing protein [Candidatus Choladousia intestinavium]